MGYFEGLTNASFKKDRSGTTVFYPCGALGRGRVISDEDTEVRIRAFITRFYKISLGSMFVVSVSLGKVWVIAVLPILCGWFYFVMSSMIKSCPFSEEKLTLLESYTNSAAGHSGGSLVFLLVTSIILVILGLAMVCFGTSNRHMLVGTLSIVLFGGAGVVVGYMLKKKWES